MKFSDILEFSFFYIKKHKLRFLLNTLTALIVITLIFISFSLCASIFATIDEDINAYLRQNDNNILIMLNGAQNGRKNNSVSLKEIEETKEGLSKYGHIEIDENIRFNDLKLQMWGENIFLDVNVIGYNNAPQIIEGEEWSEDKDDKNYLWITNDIFQGIKKIQSDFEVGSEVRVVVNNVVEMLMVKGVVEGKNMVFAGRSYLINNNFAYISYAEFHLKLYSDRGIEYIKELDKELLCLNNNFVTDDGIERLTNYEISYFREISKIAQLYVMCIICVIIFLAILIVGVFKNNSIINIYDNIETFSIMRCLGMKNSILIPISLTETYLNILISCLLGGGLSVVFKNPIKSFVNMLLTKNLIIPTTAVYNSAWWLFVVFTVILIFVATLYFSVTLTKSLKRKNLLKTLKGE